MLIYLLSGILAVLLFVAALVSYLRGHLHPEQRAQLRNAWQTDRSGVRRLSRRFLAVGIGASVLICAHWLYLVSQSTDSADYQAAMAQTQQSQGTVVAVSTPWYTCVGKPSQCGQSVSIADGTGTVLVDNYLVAHGYGSQPGESVALAKHRGKYMPTTLPPLDPYGAVALNSLVLLLIAGLFVLIGLCIRASAYALTR